MLPASRVRIGVWMAGALIVALALRPSSALAWGPHGHRIAARITEERLTPKARSAIRALLLEGDTLVSIATWADNEGHKDVPESAPWHYVNVPITAEPNDARICRGGNCVVEKIGHFRALVADPHAPRKERQRALLFLVHFVADVHQPLHVGDNRDKGGNLTQVQFLGRGTNLHRLWDSDLINAVSRDERAWVRDIEPLLTPKNIEEWSRGDVVDWTNESLDAAKTAYRHLPSEAPLPTGARLGKDYEEFAAPIIRLRLAQAGVRLANELNALFR